MTSPWQGEAADWVRTGADLFARGVGQCTDEDLIGDSLLPGWNRAFVISHVSANAQAIGRLLHWARTGIETPMYSSMEDRDREIASGADLPLADLTSWFVDSDRAVQQAFSDLPSDAWSHTVVTAQGREVPAEETLWMRSREVCIHAVDLAMGITFNDLPQGFLTRLVTEACARHSANPAMEMTVLVTTDDQQNSWTIQGEGDTATVSGTLPDIASWLVGRGSAGVRARSGDPTPALPKWL